MDSQMTQDPDATLPGTRSKLRAELVYPSIAGYTLSTQIGGGGFSKVFLATAQIKGKDHLAACKVVAIYQAPDQKHGTPPNVPELQKEVKVHRALQHDYILKFMACETFDLTAIKRGLHPGLYILLELAQGGDLFDKIAPDVGVPEDLAKFYFAQMVSGMAFIHSKGVAHRDIKPENLLLKANGDLKISDFGLCAVFKHNGKTRLLSGRCGSLPYVAPELGQPVGTGYAAEPVDIWGMGVVLYTLLVGNTPWDEPSEDSPEFRAYMTGELLQYDPWTRIKGQAKAILLAMLTIDPNHRITIDGINKHPWSMTPSQLRREQMAEALTQGLRQTGMMAYADPITRASQNYNHSQVMDDGDGYTKSESQFMRGTGNITQGGLENSITTRFWLGLHVQHAAELLFAYLIDMLGASNVEWADEDIGIIVRKAAGNRTVYGTFIFTSNEAVTDGVGTLVVMKRTKGSILHWRAFWWGIVRDPKIEQYVVRSD